MKNFVKTVFDTVFSFAGFMAFLVGASFFLAAAVISQTRIENKACLEAGLTRVSTEGGVYCVDPVNLVKIERK